MNEQSHLEAMREAVRGDRERAEEARRRSAENVRALLEPEPEREMEMEPEPEPEPEPPVVPVPPERSRLRRFFGL